MARSYAIRKLLGYVVWLTAAAGIAVSFGTLALSSTAPRPARPDASASPPGQSSTGSRAATLAPLLFGPANPQHLVLRFDQPVLACSGDPVYLTHGGQRQLCGYVLRPNSIDEPRPARRSTPRSPRPSVGWTLERPERPYRYAREIEIVVYLPPHLRLAKGPSGSDFAYCAIDDNLMWVVDELLTPERREKLRQEIERAFEEHGAALFADLQPIAGELVGDLITIAREDGPAVLQRHEAELRKIAERYRTSLVEGRLVPLVRSEIFPIARKHAEPVLWEVGEEIWSRVRLWSLAWRLVYDNVRRPKESLLQSELRRFVEKEVIPIMERHTGDFVAAVEKIVVESAVNDRVQREFSATIQEVTRDPELQRLLVTIGRELYWDNPRVREKLRARLTAPETRQALERMARRIEKVSQRIGRLLFGTLQEGITPEFASVLRRRVLQKDKRWIEWTVEASASRDDSATLVVHPVAVEQR